MKGMPCSTNCWACSCMPCLPSGETMPIVISESSGTLLKCEKFIAPGWKAVIWLSSWSVVM